MIGCTANPTRFDVPASECVLVTPGLDGAAALRLKQMLQRLCFRVRVAASVQEALELAVRRHPLLTVAAAEVAEHLAPRLRRLAEGHEERQTAVLAVLADGAPEVVLRLMLAGADECLVWPFSRQMLARRLSHLAQFA